MSGFISCLRRVVAFLDNVLDDHYLCFRDFNKQQINFEEIKNQSEKLEVK